VLRVGSSATRHQHTHSSEPTPNYTKDTICCICKEIVTSIAPEDGACKPETCRAERTQINTQLHQVGKLFHKTLHYMLFRNSNLLCLFLKLSFSLPV